MKKRFSVYLVMFGAISLLIAACGGGGGGGAAPNIVAVTADKEIALANGNDPVSPEYVTMTATVTNAGGTPLTGTTISFVITSGTGTLVNASGATTDASGIATVQVKRDPIAPAPPNKENVTVTATAAGASGSKTVKFINTPDTATVQVAINPPVTNLATLTFDLVSAPTQTPATLLVLEPINAADTLPFIGHADPNQNTFASLLFAPDTYTLFTSLNPGIDTALNSPIVGFTYGIDPTIKSLPTFSIGPNNIHAFNPSGLDLLPVLKQSNLVATTVFYLSGEQL
jgi:hypothetical protein